MADEGEEKVLEEQIQFQLKEQKDSLSTVTDALSNDPDNLELLSVHLELRQAIKDAGEALFHLNRARLLRESDSPLDQTDIEIGSKCRFLHTDGRWYNGFIVGFDEFEEGSEYAKISFLNPISESMLMCKFFQHQQCRFGSNCRLSHGVYIPVSSLKKYCPTIWEQSLVGSRVWALSNTKIWREAKLESYDEKLEMGVVVFGDDGSLAMLGTQSMTLSKYAPPHDFEEEEEESSDTTISELCEYYSSDNGGLGFSESANLQSGIQTETAIFAKWENHTRGIASKMMANMGYRDGMGLGALGQGILDPISVKILPSRISLDNAVRILESGGELTEDRSKYSKRKKHRRGGKRKRHNNKKIEVAIKAVEAVD